MSHITQMKTTMKFAALTVVVISLLVSFSSFRDKSPKKRIKKVSASNSFPKIKEDPTYIVVIDKSDYELKLYDKDGWLATYPVVFGNDDLGDKKMEGDRKTPEGTFHIIAKRPHDKWQRFMLLDYPNEESVARFNARKAKGEIPKNAKMGGGIGIHGTLQKENWSVDYYFNWTNGCISMHKDDIVELYDMLPVGTKVMIQQ